MKIEIENLPKSKVKIIVSVPYSKFKNYIDLAYKRISENLNINGFRKGKIPKEILKKTVNQEGLYNEIVKITVEKTYPEVLNKNNIKPIATPQIKVIKIIPKNLIEYSIETEILPKIKNLDYKDIKVEKRKISVENKEVEDSILWLRKSRAKYFKVQRPCQLKDLISIDFETTVNGIPIENGKDKNHYFVLGEGKFIPGFEEKLIGMEVGEEKEFNLKVDKNYHHPALANKTAHFKVKLNDVQQVELPELSDEFAKSLGRFENLKELKQSIEEGLFQEKELKEKERIRSEIIEALLKKNPDFEVPETLIQHELNKLISEIKMNVTEQGLDFNAYLSNIKETEKSLNEKLKPQAEKRAKIALILKEISEKEDIKVNQEEIEEETNKILKNPKNQEIIKKIDTKTLYNYAENIIKNEKILEFLEKNATN